jgi:MarR family transcriptional regulator, lower aerobic nicotinate degradation pathway regulator
MILVSEEEHDDGAAVVWLVGEAFRLSRRWIEEVVREEGITATQLSILKRIEFFPGISRAELARQTFISSQAAQVALSTLEDKGLVAARPTRNRRAVRTQLTAKGKRVLKRCSMRTEPILEKVVAPLDSSERKELIELLRRLVEGYGVPVRP